MARIEEIREQIAFDDEVTDFDPKDYNTWSVKAGRYIELHELTKDKNDLEQALNCYTQAIDISEKEQCPKKEYYSARSKVYAKMENYNSATGDLLEANKITGSSALVNAYVDNTSKEVLRLKEVEASIAKLKNDGKLAPELAAALEKMTSAGSTLVATTNIHEERLDGHDSKIAKLEELLATLQKDDKHSKEEQAQLMHQFGVELGAVKADVTEVTVVLADAGVYAKAEMKQAFDKLEETPELSAYCKTFYWTTINLFGAYRDLSAGVVKGDIDHDESVQAKIGVEGAKKAAGFGAEIAKGIPIIGGIIGLIDSIIDGVYTAIKENRLQNKTDAINEIIKSKFNMEEDISLEIAKISLAMTKAYELDFLNQPNAPIVESSNASSWIKGKFKDVKGKILPEIEKSNSDADKAAVADVALFMGYLCKNYKVVIENNNPLHEQAKDIYPDLQDILSRYFQSENSLVDNSVVEVHVPVVGEESSDPCCVIL